MNTENQRPEDVATSVDEVLAELQGGEPTPETSEVAATSEPEQLSVSVESPAAEPAVPVGAASEIDAALAAAVSSEPKRKVQLNPVVPGQVMPIPSLGEGRPVAPQPTAPIEVADISAAEIDAEVAKAVGADSKAAGKPEQPAAPVHRAPVAVPAAEDLDSSMQAMLDEALAQKPVQAPAAPAAISLSLDDLAAGTKLKGVVQSVNPENVLVDFGLRLSGCVPARQFNDKLPEVGATLDLVVERIDDKEGLIFANVPRATAKVQGDWDLLQVDQIVECMVTKTNKGGLDVTVGSLRGFLPASQVDLGFIADLEPFVGQKLRVVITEVKPKRRRLVVSRRQILTEERDASRQDLLANLKVDDVLNGRVKTIKDYGAFVDLGGADGFLPISQMSWSRIGHPAEIMKEGDEIEVKVLSIDTEKGRISLGTRQLATNPWKLAEAKYEKGSNVTGRVSRVEPFGAFVELEPGVEGLIHISELDHRRVKRVTEVLNVGDTPEVQVLEVDTHKKRISLSLKALLAKPEVVAPPKDEDLAPGKGEVYQRKNKANLKGGTGSAEKGGLFGDPGKFN